MEGISRLVAESLARHGFDRPLDYRRLHWSRWFRCESPHSLLLVPSKPGVFALAEEIMDLGSGPAMASENSLAFPRRDDPRSQEAHRGPAPETDSIRASDSPVPPSRRMLAVAQFFEDDDMAFVLDRMLTRQNFMRDRLASGHYFVRFVVIEDAAQRRSICNALNQWIASSAEKASAIGTHFATSLELTPATEYVPANDAQGSLFDGATPAQPATGAGAGAPVAIAAAHLDSGAAANTHCPSPLPSGF
ncbi:MAG TPA: hypothetical protein VMG31_12200 [Verrucomicrobiae bacterium]|nr:hypothetical protein [Verrucomicrobiae bacterium]